MSIDRISWGLIGLETRLPTAFIMSLIFFTEREAAGYLPVASWPANFRAIPAPRRFSVVAVDSIFLPRAAERDSVANTFVAAFNCASLNEAANGGGQRLILCHTLI